MDDVHRPLSAQNSPRYLPRITIIVLLVTGIVTGLQLFFPPVLAALRRNPQALAAGEWWRAFTPLLVHSDGWPQIIVNFLGIALVGPTVERWYGPWRWLLLYLSAGLTGEVAGYAWEPTGAGASIALCGLIGGLYVWLVRHDTDLPRIAIIYGTYFVAVLTGAAVAGSLGVLVMFVVCMVLMMLLFLLPKQRRVLVFALAVVMLGSAIALTAFQDNHGPPLLMGGAVALLLLSLAPPAL